MSNWHSLFFQDSSTLLMFGLMTFYDNVMIILSFILSLVFLSMLFIFFLKVNNRYFIEENFIEIVWTLVPIIILIFIAIPSLLALYDSEYFNRVELMIKSVGHQWYWSYEYSDFYALDFDSYMVDGKFRLLETDNSLILPLDTQVCVLTTSSDVIHSWSVSSLGLKSDSIPGRINQLMFSAERSGIFFGQCSEICGANHSFMPIKVEILPLEYFKVWLKKNI